MEVISPRSQRTEFSNIPITIPHFVQLLDTLYAMAKRQYWASEINFKMLSFEILCRIKFALFLQKQFKNHGNVLSLWYSFLHNLFQSVPIFPLGVIESHRELALNIAICQGPSSHNIILCIHGSCWAQKLHMPSLRPLALSQHLWDACTVENSADPICFVIYALGVVSGVGISCSSVPLPGGGGGGLCVLYTRDTVPRDLCVTAYTRAAPPPTRRRPTLNILLPWFIGLPRACVLLVPWLIIHVTGRHWWLRMISEQYDLVDRIESFRFKTLSDIVS